MQDRRLNMKTRAEVIEILVKEAKGTISLSEEATREVFKGMSDNNLFALAYELGIDVSKNELKVA
jgi:hypothetical protein